MYFGYNEATAYVTSSATSFSTNATAYGYAYATGGAIHEGSYAPTKIDVYGGSSFYKNNAEVQQDLAQTNAKLIAFSMTKAQAYGGAIYAAQVPYGAYPNSGIPGRQYDELSI